MSTETLALSHLGRACEVSHEKVIFFVHDAPQVTR